MAKTIPAAPPRPVSYKALGVFWAVVGTVAVTSGVILQIMGAPGPLVVASGARPATPAAAAPAPAAPKPAAIPAPEAALLEAAPPDRDDPTVKFLPQIAQDGRTPATYYAAPYDKSDKHPRLAFVIDGIGLDQTASLQVLNTLPAAVTIAFDPYTPKDTLDRFAASARSTGHECLLSIPMEPFGYPTVEEGGRELLSTGRADTEGNITNLVWALSRAGGCVGATGAMNGRMGERFAQTDDSFADLLTEINRRGLLYLDPNTGANAILNNTASNIRVANKVVDQSDPETPVSGVLLDQRLAELEYQALHRGSAIGLAGPPTPLLLEHVSAWMNQLAAHGVALVPLTAIPSGPAAAAAVASP